MSLKATEDLLFHPTCGARSSVGPKEDKSKVRLRRRRSWYVISARVSDRAAWGFMEAKRRDFCPTTTQVTHQSGSNPNSPGKQVSGALFRLCRSAIPNAFLLIVLTPSHFVALCNIVAPQRTHVAPSILNPLRARSAQPPQSLAFASPPVSLNTLTNSCCCVLGWPHCRFLTI